MAIPSVPTFVGEPSLLGAEHSQLVGLGVYLNTDAMAMSVRPITLSPIDRTRHDDIRVRIRSTIDSTLDVTYTLPVLTWVTLRGAAEGTDLSVNRRGIPVFPIGAHSRTIWIGRHGNVVTVQAGTLSFSSQITVEVFGAGRTGGVIDAKISALQSHVARTLIMHRLVPTADGAPDAPTITFEGAVPSAPDWLPIDSPLMAADTTPEYIATAEATFDHQTGSWNVGTASVTAGGTNFEIQYASSEDGPWGSADPGTEDLWVRYRLPTGEWSAHRVRGAQTPAMLTPSSAFAVSFSMLGTGRVVQPSGIYPPFAWDGATFVEVRYQLSGGNQCSAFVPAVALRSRIWPTVSADNGRAIQLRVGNNGATWAIGPTSPGGSNDASAHDLTVDLLTHVAAEGGTRMARTLRATRGFSGIAAALSIHVW